MRGSVDPDLTQVSAASERSSRNKLIKCKAREKKNEKEVTDV